MFQNDRDVIYGETAAQRKKIQDIKTFSYLFRRYYSANARSSSNMVMILLSIGIFEGTIESSKKRR